MAELNSTALATLHAAGLTVAEWCARNYMRDSWCGDACGCPDSRCIGHHHDGPDDCGCLTALLGPATECQMANTVPTPYAGIAGKTRYRADCVNCGTVCTGWTPRDALDAFEEHRAIPAPPDELRAVPLTHATFQKYCDYYIRGRGRPVASRARCPHDVVFTDSPCGMCDDDEVDSQ